MNGHDRLTRQLVAALQVALTKSGKPQLPEAGLVLWDAFLSLSLARSWHRFGPNPISFTEIEAFGRLMRIPLAPHHVHVILALDSAWLEHSYAKQRQGQTRADGVKTLPAVSSHPLTARLFDIATS